MSVELKTEQLKIVPLNCDELRLLIELYRESVPELSAAYREMLNGCLTHKSDYLWYTAWRISLLNSSEEVGFAGFKGINNGYVEIGYGINEGYEGHGYATQAVKELCRWALSMPKIVAVEAEAEESNIASRKVLLNAGFTETGCFGEEGLRYLLSI